MTTTGIYSIADLEGNCLYMGQSRTIELRWKRHLSSLRSGKHLRKDFVRWFEESGRDVSLMKFQILEELPDGCPEEELNEREIHWFNFDMPRFYGKLPSAKEKWQHSEETKEKISQANIKRSEELGTRPKPRTCEYCKEVFTPKHDRGSTRHKYCSYFCSGRSKSRLTEQDRLDILVARPHQTFQSIADKYGVSKQSIIAVVRTSKQVEA